MNIGPPGVEQRVDGELGRLQRSAINMISGLAGWLTPILINFGATPFLIHGLGPDAYGLQNLVGVVVGYFAIMDMGVDIAGVKFLAEYHAQRDTESENRLLGTSFQIYGVIGLVGMFLILLSAELLATHVFLIPGDLTSQAVTVFRLGALGFLANMLVAWGNTVSQGLQRYDVMNLVTMATSATGMGVGLGAVYLGYGVIGYVLVRIVMTSLAAMAYFVIARRLLPTLRWRFGIDWEMVHRVGGVAIYGLVLRITGIVTATVDRTLIGAWLGTTAVTLYAVPSLVATSLGQFVPRIMSFLFPMASELARTGQYETMGKIFTKIARFIIAVSTIIFLPIFVLADLLLALWVGPEIAVQSTAVFRLLLAAGYLTSFSILAGTIVPGLGRFRLFTLYAVGKALVIGISCAMLIHPLGIAGAGIGVLLGSIVDVVFTLFSLQYYLQISGNHVVRWACLRPLTVGAVLGGLVFLTRPLASTWWGMGLVLAMGGLLFVAIGYAIGVFGETEKRALLAVTHIKTICKRGI